MRKTQDSCPHVVATMRSGDSVVYLEHLERVRVARERSIADRPWVERKRLTWWQRWFGRSA